MQAADNRDLLHQPVAHAPPPEEEPAESSEPDPDEEALTDDDPDEWRVAVKIHSYQRRPSYDILWIARDESLDSWMTRAHIILGPVDRQCELVLPLFQPETRFVCLLLVLRLWAAQGKKPVLVCDVRRPDEAYLEAVGPEDGLRDFMPSWGQERSEMVAVFQGPRVLTADATFHDAILPGDALFYQPHTWPAPPCVEARHLLADPGRAWRAGDALPTLQTPTLRYLLLGQGEAHSLYDLRVGLVLPQIADATGIPSRSLRIKTQLEVFPDLCVQGSMAHRCLAYRDLDMLLDSNHFILFIDPRHLGLPVCARLVKSLRLTVAALLHLAGAVVPEAFVSSFADTAAVL